LPPPGELAFEVANLTKAKKIVEFRRQKKMDTMFIEDLVRGRKIFYLNYFLFFKENH